MEPTALAAVVDRAFLRHRKESVGEIGRECGGFVGHHIKRMLGL